MTLDDDDLRNVYQRATRRRDRDDCPSEETLMKAARNALPARERNAVVEHVAQCSDCARDFKIARSLVPWANEASKKEREEERNLSPFAIAATVAIAVSIPLIVWLVLARTGASRAIDHLNGEIARRDQEIRALRINAIAMRAHIDQQMSPEIGTPIVDLDSDDVRGASVNAEPTIDVPRSAHSFALIVHLPFSRARSFELRDRDDRLIWRADAPSNATGMSVTITLPRDLVPAGEYLLHATADNDRADFRFRVRYAGT